MKSMPFFTDLVSRTDEARRAFETHPVLLDAVANGLPVERYRKLMLELYHVVWHFNPVCAAAASRIGDAHRQIRYHLYEHRHEEQGHEQWVMNDLEAVGIEPAVVRAHQPSVVTLALNGYNYWVADRRHPCSAMGMLYTLEVIASVYGGPFSEAMRERLLLDGERGISFIGSHATMDAKHMAELRGVLNTLHDDEARDAIIEAALVNFHHFTCIIGGV
jgi:pyrroloquinoline quinone (PQQ) biosynthesis protein C